MAKPFLWLEQLLYRVRDGIWDYPDWLLYEDDSVMNRFNRFYVLTRPYSHFIASLLLIVALGYIALASASSPLFASVDNKLIEGIVIGEDEFGNVQQLSKVNPLLPTSIQLEKDLNQLIYEPLIRYESDASISPILAESIIRVREGSEYEFILKSDIFWHDGHKFEVEDVARSLEIISELDDKTYGDNSYVRAVKQMAWEKTGDNSIRICTTSPQILEALPASEKDRPCSAVSSQKPILANFLELISIPIIPSHLSADINALTINTPQPVLNRFPIGTGPYRFAGVDGNIISILKYDDYHGVKPSIPRIEFKLFKNTEAAVQALENGEIHSFATTSTEHLRDLARYQQTVAYKSPVLTTQYWAIYFNLRTDLDGNPLGPNFFQDQQVRQALSMAVNRERIISTLLDVGKEAIGPIYKESEFFSSAAPWYRYNEAGAASKLTSNGWVINKDTGIREKNGVQMSFSLSFVDSFDRRKVVESIRQDMERVGVELIPDPRPLQELTEQVVTPKLFDSLLYGMSTFIDPDRYELFHSGEALNLASYSGSEETVKIENRQTVRVPRVDKLLEQARSYDPLGAKDVRKDSYNQFQGLLASDAPAVFLYRPQFLYYVSNRIENMDLSKVDSLEQRFRNVAKWRLTN